MRLPILLIAAALSLGCSRTGSESITADALMNHIRVLASDEFEGRAPGTRGEERTVQYLIQQFTSMGLKPGNPDGTYVQKAPLVGIRSRVEAALTAGGKKLELEPRENFIALSRRCVPDVKVDGSDVIFVGYGVVAPEYGWDDYKGVDVKGKTIVMLINDPAVPDPADPSKLDEKFFKGRAMTYYGRWTYKYEIASEKGAAAAIIVHETGPAGYPFAVVGGSWGRENFDIQRADRNMGRVPVESWISFDKAKEWFSMAGQDLEALKKVAVTKDFRPVPLRAKAGFKVRNELREVQSQNVIARLEGATDEYVIYTAHWDHLGRDESLKGDQIFNGALDNASGTAALLVLAEAYSKLPQKPKRNILFLSVTAEEKGLLGALYYAENPLYPLKKTLADINIDGLNQWGRTRDITLVGPGDSALDRFAEEVVRSQGRVLRPDPEPEKGMYYRSDHFEFAKRGVPALYTHPGIDFIGKPQGWGLKKREEYTEKDYHKVSDEIKPDWDLTGAAEDVQFLFQVGRRVSSQ